MKLPGSVLVAVLILTTTAVADNPANWVPSWQRPPKPAASPTVPVPVPAPQTRAKPDAAPPPAAESRPAPLKVQPRLVERAKPKVRVEERPRPKPKEGPPPADVCAKISWGMTFASRDRVISEGMKRGYSRATVEKAIRDCGY